MIDLDEYCYKYELHLHTNQASACAKRPGAEMARACKEAGYDGIVVTDHAWGGNTSVDRSLPWREWVFEFAEGYEDAKRWGDENGLLVMFGYESGYRGTEFLVFGTTPDFLADHPELRTADIPEQYRIIHEGGGVVIQAHPFRKEDYIPEVRLFPKDVDGAETVNATHSSHLSRSHNIHEWDTMAIAYARENSLIMTAGSDIHDIPLLGGGILSKEKLKSSEDLCNLLLSDRMYLLSDGDRIYDRYGNLLKDYIE